jgi:hypothetical protein
MKNKKDVNGLLSLLIESNILPKESSLNIDELDSK